MRLNPSAYWPSQTKFVSSYRRVSPSIIVRLVWTLEVPSRNPSDAGSFSFRLSVTASPARMSQSDASFAPGDAVSGQAASPAGRIGPVVSQLPTGFDPTQLLWPSVGEDRGNSELFSTASLRELPSLRR